jgi:hypothetical protein
MICIKFVPCTKFAVAQIRHRAEVYTWFINFDHKEKQHEKARISPLPGSIGLTATQAMAAEQSPWQVRARVVNISPETALTQSLVWLEQMQSLSATKRFLK